MKSLVLVAALAVSALPGSLAASPHHDATQAPAEGGALDSADRKFLTEASQGGILEVKLGQLATKQAASEDVRKFGQRMVDDHTKINGDLAKLLQQKGLTLPQALDKNHQEKVDKLAKKSGVAFDKDYMDCMVDDHQEDVKDFEKASKDVKDAALKAFAANTLPTLREHLTSAKAIQAVVKDEKKP